MCTEMASELSMRSDLPHEAGAGLLGLRFGQVRAPGDDLHIERKRVASQTRSEAAETDDAERLASQAYADRHAVLEPPGPHGPIGGGYGASGGDHQAEREFRGGVWGARAGACRVADRNSETRASRDVQQSVRSACDADHAQLGETADQGFREKQCAHALSEECRNPRARCNLVLCSESVSEKHQVSASSNWGLDQSALLRATPYNHRELRIFTIVASPGTKYLDVYGSPARQQVPL